MAYVTEDVFDEAIERRPPPRRWQVTLRDLTVPLMVMVYVLYVPLGPDMIYNQFVRGPGGGQALEKIWGLARNVGFLTLTPLFLLTRSAFSRWLRCWPVFPFTLLSLASITWSPYPKDSWHECQNLIGIVVWMSCLASWNGLAEFVRSLHKISASIMILSVLVAVFVPRIGVHHATDVLEPIHAGRWRGIFLHKNVLGEFSALAFVFAFRSLKKETPAWRAFFRAGSVSMVLCLVMARSGNSIVGLVGVGVFILLMRNRVTAHPLSLAFVALLAVLLYQGLSVTPAELLALIGKDPTFTGRTQIWALGWPMMQQHLLFGTGLSTETQIFGAIAKDSLFESAVDLHNSYLDIMFNLGIVGAACFLFLYIAAMVRGYTFAQSAGGEDREAAIILMGLIVLASIQATGETSPFRILGDGAAAFWSAVPALFQAGRTLTDERGAGDREGLGHPAAAG